MEMTSSTSMAIAAGLAAERPAGFAFSLDGFNSRMAERLHRVEVLTGKKSAEKEETAPVRSYDENVRS